MVSLDQALENSRNSFTSGEFIAKLSGLVRIVTDSKNSVSNEDLISYYSEGLLSILTELGIKTKIIGVVASLNEQVFKNSVKGATALFMRGE